MFIIIINIKEQSKQRHRNIRAKIATSQSGLSLLPAMLRGRSFREVLPNQNSSWSWKKLLGLRPLALEFMEWEGGIGRWKIPGGKYKAAAVWREIRPRRDKVEWHRLLWGSFTVPKYSFIAWMAVLDRLPTKDRMQSWGIVVDRQ